jgi:hypothetical protein
VTKEEANQLPLGVYRLFWKQGGSSLAAVGQLHDGTHWFAPSNWSSKNVQAVGWTDKWRQVETAQPIETNRQST